MMSYNNDDQASVFVPGKIGIVAEHKVEHGDGTEQHSDCR
jgi:hypothetical protein